MNHRRLVGIDLGIATAHTVRVLDGEGTAVAKRKAWPTAWPPSRRRRWPPARRGPGWRW
jgi:hypothetical protein